MVMENQEIVMEKSWGKKSVGTLLTPYVVSPRNSRKSKCPLVQWSVVIISFVWEKYDFIRKKKGNFEIFRLGQSYKEILKYSVWGNHIRSF